MIQSWSSTGRDAHHCNRRYRLSQKDISLDVGAARAGLVVAHYTDRLDIVDLRSIQASAADIHVRLAVELRATESRRQSSAPGP